MDATTLEANAAMRSIKRRDTEESYEAFVRRLAEASGVETPTRAELARFDRSRKGRKTSNEDWKSPQDPDAKIAPLPSGLRSAASLDDLDIFLTWTCAPSAWQDWLATIDEFSGRLCESGADVTIDVAVVYTQAAREAAGGVAEIEAVIDLMIAQTNQAYEASGGHQRVALVARSETPSYVETRNGSLDLRRLRDPSDGYMDEVHVFRDRGADLVHLIVDRSDVCGIAYLVGAFGLTLDICGGSTSHMSSGTTWGCATTATCRKAERRRIRRTVT